jgi:hypothetical protein
MGLSDVVRRLVEYIRNKIRRLIPYIANKKTLLALLIFLIFYHSKHSPTSIDTSQFLKMIDQGKGVALTNVNLLGDTVLFSSLGSNFYTNISFPVGNYIVPKLM